MQTHPNYPTLDAIDNVLKKYYQWEQVNDVTRTFILTSLTLELYEKLQDFPYASDVLDFLEVRFRKQSLIPKQNTNTKIAKVISIENEVVKLKELGLLNTEVNDQFMIDEILKSVILYFKEFKCKHNGKEVCSSSKLVSSGASSIVEPKPGMLVGETSFSEPKGEEEKKKTKKDGKAIFIGVNKAGNKPNVKSKLRCFYCKENGHCNCLKYLTFKCLCKSFIF